MIKYCCDRCGQEVNESYFAYKMPKENFYAPNYALGGAEEKIKFLNTLNLKYNIKGFVEDENILLCPECREEVSFLFSPFAQTVICSACGKMEKESKKSILLPRKIVYGHREEIKNRRAYLCRECQQRIVDSLPVISF